MSGETGTGKSEWRAGGWMLFAAMICYTCSPLPYSVIGILIKPLGEEFGWPRAAVAAPPLIASIGTLLIAPLVGHLVDRVGPRRIGLTMLLALPPGMILVGMAGPSLASWYAVWALFAVIQAGSGAVIWSNGVVSRFDKNRGMALAILLTVQALSYGFMPRIGVYIMSEFGWRAIFHAMAVLPLAIAWPLAYFFFYGEADLDRIHGRTPAASRPVAKASSAIGAVVSRQFWQLALAFTIGAATVAALFIHMVPLLTDRGISAESAATVAIILGPASIMGRFASGFLLDRLSSNLVAATALVLPGISYAIMIFGGQSIMAACIGALFLGFTLGAESDLMAYLVSRYFGREAFSSTYGLLLGFYSVGYGIAPMVAGAVYDKTGSYDPVFYTLMGGAFFAALLIWRLGSPRPSKEAAA